MSELSLSVALGDYDRVRPILDGRVQIDGVEPVTFALSPEEIFFRAFRHAEFDICELSLSSYCVMTQRGTSDYIGIPAFPSRAFRHTSIYVRKDRITRPEDLKGCKIGVPEYQLTANVWVRAILEEYDVHPRDIHWIRGGLEEPGRLEKIALKLPPDVKLENAPEGRTLSQMLDTGEIDAVITPRMPSVNRSNSNIGWLFDDPTATAKDYFKRTGIFPIMHLMGIRKDLVERHPWLPNAVFKASVQAKDMAMDLLRDTSATKVTLPFVEEQLVAAEELMGDDFWPYGVERNRRTLDAFLGAHHTQGLSARRLCVEELFHHATLEQFAI